MNSRSINNAILGAIILVSTLFASCNKPKNDDVVPPANTIGSFNFDQKDYPVVSAGYSWDQFYIFFMFASQDIDSEKVSCYFTLALKNGYIGKGVINAEEVWHNDDYSFIFETPAVYYSNFRKVTGQIEVKENSKDNFTVNLDLLLIDGKPFKFSYTGEILEK